MQPSVFVIAVFSGFVFGMVSGRRSKRSSFPTAPRPYEDVPGGGEGSEDRNRHQERKRRRPRTVYRAEVAIGGKTYALACSKTAHSPR